MKGPQPHHHSSLPWQMAAALAAAMLLNACVGGRLQQVPEHPPAVGTPAFTSSLASVAKAEWTGGNQVRTLVNGAQFFPAMLDAIRSARHTVTFETYVCVNSPQVKAFTDAFRERARAGVKVHLILDAYGCNTYGRSHLAAMRRDGVQIQTYSCFDLLRPMRYNHRTHRRILVVDGKVGFVGGAGIAYAWDGNAEDPLRWRDTQYELRGPVVAQLQQLFNENWQELTGSPLAGDAFFPRLQTEGVLRAHVVAGSPGKGEETIGSSCLLAFRAARRSLLISHSYFLPNQEITEALVKAAARGVKVELIIPGKHTDMPICFPTAAPSLLKLLEAGVAIYEFEPCMMHNKLIVVDDCLTIAGSGNIDSRSFFINDENNLHVLSRTFAAEQRRVFHADKARSRRLTREDFHLSLGDRFHGFIGRLVEHQL
jgi:cardiolipin synthase